MENYWEIITEFKAEKYMNILYVLLLLLGCKQFKKYPSKPCDIYAIVYVQNCWYEPNCLIEIVNAKGERHQIWFDFPKEGDKVCFNSFLQ